MTPLFEYLEGVKRTPFAWGSHDCLTFTNEAWRRLHGRAWSEDWLGVYMHRGKPVGARTLKKRLGVTTLEEAMQGRLRPVAGIPPRGALVLSDSPQGWSVGISFGIALGTTAVFVGLSGLEHAPITSIAGAWIN